MSDSPQDSGVRVDGILNRHLQMGREAVFQINLKREATIPDIYHECAGKGERRAICLDENCN